MANIRICKVCGKTIEYCGNCDHSSAKQYWKNEYCSDDCRNIFHVCCRFVGKDIDKVEASKLLKDYGVNDKSIGSAVKETVDEIMAVGPVEEPIQEKQAVDDVVSEPQVVEDIAYEPQVVEDESGDDIVISKHQRRRRMKRTSE